MAYVETKTGSWNYEAEREYGDEVSLMSTPFRQSDFIAEDDIQPYAINPTGWMPVESQLSQGSCRGQSLSSCLEYCRVLAGNTFMQLSRAAAYYETQRIDGIRGDRGSTIGGGVKLAQEHGIPSEDDWGYPRDYNPRRPDGYDQMTKHYTEGHISIRPQLGKDATDIAIQHLCGAGGRKGPVDIGIMWGSSIDRQASSGVIKDYRPGGGGHAITILGPVDRYWDGSSIGDWALLLFNSWSQRWGHNGIVIVLRQAFNAMMQDSRMNIGVGHFGYKGPKSSFDDLMT